MAGDKRLISSEISDAGVVNLYGDVDNREVFADGFGQLQMGPSVTKLRVYTTTDVAQAEGKIVEDREIIMTLVIPTLSLVQFLTGVIPTLQPRIQGIVDHIEATKNSIAALK